MKTVDSPAFVIPITEKERWTQYVVDAYAYDFYHTWDYHTLAATDEPMMFVFQQEGKYVAFPLLKRQISQTNYYDLHAVYGYAGPICNIDFALLDKNFISQFQKELSRFLQEGNYVSVFAKFNPFFNQQLLFDRLGGIYDNGVTVAIDLGQSIEYQRMHYRSSTADAIKKARRLDFTIREMDSEKDVADFNNLYLKNMDRIDASEFYRFNGDYFAKLLSSSQCNAKLVLCYYGQELVAGSVITLTKGILQAHLIASNADYLKYSPAKFLVDEVSVMGREKGMKYYHLGGGLGYKQDTLYKWKKGFSDLVFRQASWRYIVKPAVYQMLVQNSGLHNHADVDFFPLYRYKPQPVNDQK